jgi:hypothetical protein
MRVWCVAWHPRDEHGQFDATKQEWCACRTQLTNGPRYQDNMRTKCGMVVTLTTGIEFREPTCPDCRKKLSNT